MTTERWGDKGYFSPCDYQFDEWCIRYGLKDHDHIGMVYDAWCEAWNAGINEYIDSQDKED